MFFILSKNIYNFIPLPNTAQSLIFPNNSRLSAPLIYIVKTLVRPTPTSTRHTACNSVRHLRHSACLSAPATGKFILYFSCKSALYYDSIVIRQIQFQ